MEAQETMALEHSRLPIRQELYADEYYEQASQLEAFSEIVYTNCNAVFGRRRPPGRPSTTRRRRSTRHQQA